MLYPEFGNWLQSATRDLPKDVLSQVQDELRAHFEDAVDEYVMGGKSHDEARAAALADLGNADETSAALKHIHLAPRRYALAALASIAPYLILIGYALLMIFGGLSYANALIIFYPLTFGCTLFVLNTFNTLLPFQGIRTPLRLVTLGILFILVIYIGGMLYSDTLSLLMRWGIVNFNEPTLNYNFAPAQTPADLLVDVGFVLAAALMAAGGIWIGRRLLRVRDALHHITGLAFLLHGVAMMLQITAVLVHNVGATGTITMMITLLGITKYAACGLLFFRAARIGSAFPTRTA
ncbi:MAG: permease prefix domain 1-containing protein [Anaerolineae bacterium]